jgi:hypothetical protein
MKSIYVHLRPDQFSFSDQFENSAYVYNDTPAYAVISIKQTERFLKDTPILLTNETVNREFSSEIEMFFNLCKEHFPSFYKNPFWFLTLLRLYVVFLYCNKENINEFVHLEYDNLIYSDLSGLKKLPPCIYFTKLGPYCSSAGFVYCNSLVHFERFIQRVKSLIQKGEVYVRKFTGYDFLSEMIMIDLISSHTKDVMGYLPILPLSAGSENFDRIGELFDCASYGQYLGGTHGGNNNIGWHGLHQYVGQQIHNKHIKIIFENKMPFVLYNDKKIPICNLHIHSKKLENFTCFDEILLEHKKNNSSFKPSEIITGNSFKLISDDFLDEEKPFLDISKKPKIIFLKTDWIELFKTKILPKIDYKFKLITHNADRSAPSGNLDLLEDSRLERWYSMNCDIEHTKLQPIPIGMANEKWAHGDKSVLVNAVNKKIERNNLVYCNYDVSTSPHKRLDVLKILKGKGFVDIDMQKRPYSEYLEKLKSYKYVISPPGNGIDCHRIWESIYLGVVPIVEKSTTLDFFKDLPILFVDTYDNINEDMLIEHYDTCVNKNNEKAFFSFYSRQIL